MPPRWELPTIKVLILLFSYFHFSRSHNNKEENGRHVEAYHLNTIIFISFQILSTVCRFLHNFHHGACAFYFPFFSFYSNACSFCFTISTIMAFYYCLLVCGNLFNYLDIDSCVDCFHCFGGFFFFSIKVVMNFSVFITSLVLLPCDKFLRRSWFGAGRLF